MNSRRLLSNTVLYGVADMIVLAVGGFLLLPLYTRAMSQVEFGTYVIVRANTDIFMYVLYMGLPSAMARVYFDYKKEQQHTEYISSLIMFFLLMLGIFGALLAVWGEPLWQVLSPATPAYPYLAFSVALAALGFLAALATTWLRVEQRAAAFAGLQVGAAAVLIIAAAINLLVLKNGVSGLLMALLISTGCSALALPWLLGRAFRPRIQWEHIRDTLHYALPIMVGYIAYFLLSRMSTLLLQRHVAVDQVAIYGLAQQLALMVTIAAMAFGKAAQPAVFAAAATEAGALMRRAAGMLIPLMFWVTSSIILFSDDVFAIVAPPSYEHGYDILLLLLVGSYAYSFMVISDTALLYHRRPRTSVAVTMFGAACAAGLGLWLIPIFQLYGAAAAAAGSFLAMAIASYCMAYRHTRHAYWPTMVAALTAMCLIAMLAAWLHRQGLPRVTGILIKVVLESLIMAGLYFSWRRNPVLPSKIPLPG